MNLFDEEEVVLRNEAVAAELVVPAVCAALDKARIRGALRFASGRGWKHVSIVGAVVCREQASEAREATMYVMRLSSGSMCVLVAPEDATARGPVWGTLVESRRFLGLQQVVLLALVHDDACESLSAALRRHNPLLEAIFECGAVVLRKISLRKIVTTQSQDIEETKLDSPARSVSRPQFCTACATRLCGNSCPCCYPRKLPLVSPYVKIKNALGSLNLSPSDCERLLLALEPRAAAVLSASVAQQWSVFVIVSTLDLPASSRRQGEAVTAVLTDMKLRGLLLT